MPLRAIDAIISQQALITGNVQDALTGRPPFNPPVVELLYQSPMRRYPLTAHIRPSGHFVFAGDPATAFPRLEAGAELALRLRASAIGYQAATSDFVLTAAMLQPVAQELDIEGVPTTVLLLNAPLLQRQIALSPVPLHLAGRVVDANDREMPIANAEVRITAPVAHGPVSSDADGFFTLQNLPVALEVTAQVTYAAFTPLTQVIRLEYGHAVHQQLFALSA
jgi:hypothetical protein